MLDLDGDICVMNADGSGRVNLTPGGVGQDTGPTWSPDGTKIVFASSRTAAGPSKIYMMNATDGSNETQVTTDGFSSTASRPGRPTASASRSCASQRI